MPKDTVPKTRTLVYSDRAPSLHNLSMYPVGSQIPRGDKRVDGEIAPTGNEVDLTFAYLLSRCCNRRLGRCLGKKACDQFNEGTTWKSMTLNEIWKYLTAIHHGTKGEYGSR